MKDLGAILAQKQLDAYNKQDLDAFLSVYSEDVLIMEFPTNTVTTQGIDEMRQMYAGCLRKILTTMLSYCLEL